MEETSNSRRRNTRSTKWSCALICRIVTVPWQRSLGRRCGWGRWRGRRSWWGCCVWDRGDVRSQLRRLWRGICWWWLQTLWFNGYWCRWCSWWRGGLLGRHRCLSSLHSRLGRRIHRARARHLSTWRLVVSRLRRPWRHLLDNGAGRLSYVRLGQDLRGPRTWRYYGCLCSSGRTSDWLCET